MLGVLGSFIFHPDFFGRTPLNPKTFQGFKEDLGEPGIRSHFYSLNLTKYELDAFGNKISLFSNARIEQDMPKPTDFLQQHGSQKG
jgi:hypothetical protein